MPPPPSRSLPPAPAPTILTASTAGLSEIKPYPIVPSFRDWSFPHNNLPPEWTACPKPPASDTSTCCVTGFRMATNKCHLVPANQRDWFVNNDMHTLYASSLPGSLGDKANHVLMRADIHSLFDQHRFAVVPKPCITPPGLDHTRTRTSSHVFAVHVLKDDEDSGELYSLYHNVALQPSAVSRLSCEFLFARFAWSVFAHLQPFLVSSTARYVVVRSDTESRKWLNSKAWASYQARRGDSRDGSRKRSASRISGGSGERGDETRDSIEVDYQESRQRRRRRSLVDILGSPGINYDDDVDDEYDVVARYEPYKDEQQQLEENTRWYE